MQDTHVKYLLILYVAFPEWQNEPEFIEIFDDVTLQHVLTTFFVASEDKSAYGFSMVVFFVLVQQEHC